MKKLTILFCLVISIAMSVGMNAEVKESAYVKPQICPQPVSCQLSSTEYVPFETIQLSCKDEDSMNWAKRHLKEWYGKYAPKVVYISQESATLEEEEYKIRIGKDAVRVDAGSLQGVRYALYSLRQIAVPERGKMTVEGWIVPEGTIEDKPQMDFRGIHICWFHETEAWEVERLIRLAAYYKMNYAVIESWGAYRSKIAPWFGWQDGNMTVKEVKRLNALAKDLGVTLIPQLNVFGHATLARGGTGKHAVLDINPEYQPLFEPFNGWNFCISNPKTRQFLQEMIAELMDVYDNPPFFHIGGDEANLPSCPDCINQSYSQLFIDHIKAMNETVASKGARTMMWHDMLLDSKDPRWKGFVANGNAETSEGFTKFPKDIIICDWCYREPRESYPTFDYFKQQGFSVLTCPWDKTAGMVAQVKHAVKAGLDGVLGTIWHHDYGKNLRNIYFTLANVMWNPEVPVPGSGYFYTHLRQVGWDMNIKDPRHGGTYYYDIPTEPFLNN